MFRRILIANRGEIAMRIMRAARELGIETVAVYSEADRGALYLRYADETICIGPAPSSESYLNIPSLISAAEIADVEAIHPGWLGRMLELGQQPEVGIVGAKLLYPDGESIQHAGVCVGMYGAAEHYGKFLRPPKSPGQPGFPNALWNNHEVSAVTAACLLIRKDAFDKIGGFDESLAVGFGDVDLCLRVHEHGYSVLFCAQAELLHHESYTRGKSAVDPHPEDSAKFQAKWRKMLKTGDPYYNPGFSLMNTSWHYTNPMNCSLEVKSRVFRRAGTVVVQATAT